jgi:magnesium chelatase family protein
MLVKTFGSAVYGVEAITITVEVNVTEGLHTFIVGLPDNAVKESIQRVESAIKTNGYFMPRTKLIVNLAPAGIRKSGAAFDLPIALGVLAATNQITATQQQLKDYVIMGELGLGGSIHSIKGALPIAIQAKKDGFKGLIIPRQNAQEANIVKGLNVFSFNNIKEVIGFFKDGFEDPPAQPSHTLHTNRTTDNTTDEMDFSDVKGQDYIKRALEIAAAGSHNVLLIGAPGAGKTMLAKRLPTILPPLSLQEALETTKIHSVAGKLPEHGALIMQRPFRSPHHTVSANALVGGGSIPQPGEISLAHNGVLFLDELPEFNRSVLEVMRQPMEDGRVTVSRAKMSVDFPASFMLLAAMNPCPCGYYNHPDKECNCYPGAVQKYLNKISGPLLDRIDLHVEVVPVPYADLSAESRGETSSAIRTRVIKARQAQTRRYKRQVSNAHMTSRMIKESCRIDTAGENLLREAMNRLHLSARAYDRILKVARTIADLAGEENIRTDHMAEAIQFRCLDREGWGA